MIREQWVNETTGMNWINLITSKWIKVYNEKLPQTKWHSLPAAVVSDYQINERNDRHHNSHRLRIHVHGGASEAYWGDFTNPLSPHAVALQSRLYTQWYATAHGYTCTPQRAWVPTSAANEAAYVRFFPLCSKLHPRSQRLHNTPMIIQRDSLSLQALTPCFPASEAITGHGNYKMCSTETL